ncbi:hypothetical protein EDEG_00621 [Edhazardia aedis USNM 41457]|uniref:Uncharacterized protein n=1 Tax=Edhazardia aedis (strain USNM 41457) TaxID=1003232 RepID=J9A083_EDHAE|nr:hypothetical protein EDEG_00621 [Edhazardia aedis USNM 41457]|eukprot:EJW05318.1 hypothetical protein EDEG_00621 [Edhazardia aedis USNM 41457]
MSKKSSSDENQNNSEAEIDSNILENKNIKKSKNEDIMKNMEKKIENKELKSRCANDDTEKKAENENVQENLVKNQEEYRFENIKRNSKNNQNLQPIDFKNKKLKKTSQKEYINFAISDNINNIEEKEEEMKILENEEGASQSEESVEEYIKLLKDALRSTDPTSGFVYDVFTENPHVKIETNRLPEETLDQNCRFLKVINKVCQRENVFEKLQAEEEQFKKSDLERRVFNDKENEVYERYKKLILSRLLQKITGKTTEEKLFLEKMNLMLETNFKEVLETSFLGSTDGPKKYPLLCLIECFKEQKEKEKCVLEDRINANPCVVNDDGTLNSLDPCNEDISHESVQPGGLKGYENFVSLQDKVYQEAREDKKLRVGYKENSLLSMVEKIDSSNINNLVTNIYPDVSGKFINQTKTTFAFQHNPKMVDLFNIKKDDNQKEKISIFDKPYNLETSKSAKNNDSEKCQFLEFQNNKNNANLFVVKNKLSKNSSNTAFTNIDTSESQSQSSEYDQCEFLNPLQKKSKNKNDETTVSTFSDEKFNKESILLKYVDGVFHEIGPGNIIISMFKNNNRLTFVRKNIHMFSFDVLLTFDPTPRLKDKYTMCFMISGKGIYALRFKDTLFLQQFHNILNKCIDEFRQTHKTEKEIAEENQKITEENDKNNNFANQGEKIVNGLIFCENNEEKHVEIKEDQKNKIKDKEDNYKHQN